MDGRLSRREWLKHISVAGGGALLSGRSARGAGSSIETAPVLPLTSASEVTIPPRGRSFMKFSFDFPEPSIEVSGLRFAFLVFTSENCYGLDASATEVAREANFFRLLCRRFVWAGGQESSPGRLEAEIRAQGDAVEWDASVEMDRPIKAVTTVIRGVPRGRISSAGARFFDPGEDFDDAFTEKIDGDRSDLNWVDWDNDRHQDGWLSYMNLGVDSWRRFLTERIASILERFRPDAYFLDIVGGFVNNPKADMHEGTRRLVEELRGGFPTVLAAGEMHYDALLAFLPFYHSFSQTELAPFVRKHARFFQHLSHPAPGRGSTGVHEAGFQRFDPETLSLTEHQIPTLNVVDDTFARHRWEMEAVIARARERAGI